MPCTICSVYEHEDSKVEHEDSKVEHEDSKVATCRISSVLIDMCPVQFAVFSSIKLVSSLGIAVQPSTLLYLPLPYAVRGPRGHLPAIRGFLIGVV